MKYYHVMPIENFIHNESIIKMINENPKYFKKDEHFFVVSSRDGYNKYKDINNIIYDDRIIKKNKHKVIEYYAKKADYLFLHCNNLKFYELFLMKKNSLNKIIWGVWGSDLYEPDILSLNNYEKIKLIIKKTLLNKIIKIKVRQFFALGIGFKYDALEIRKKYGDVKILPLLYGYNSKLKQSIEKIMKSQNKISNKPIKIMIGHSAFPFLNHIKILKMLEKYKEENIIISLPLNYGYQKYAKDVVNTAKEIFGNKIEVIYNHMEFEDYFNYIMNIDICILDFKHQSALGNLWLLLKTRTKLFLNSDGIIKNSMMFELIETYDVKKIDKMSFEEFSKKLENPDNGVEFSNFYLDQQTAIEMFYSTITYLKNVKEENNE